MSEADHDPYPDEDGTVYEYTGSGLKVPDPDGDRKVNVEQGETVRLPDRAAEPLADSLREVDPGGGDVVAEVEDAGAESEPDVDEADGEGDAGDGEDVETSADDAEGALAVPDDVDPEDLPEDFPEELPTDDYPLLQRLASENGLDAQVDRPTLVESLENARDGGGD